MSDQNAEVQKPEAKASKKSKAVPFITQVKQLKAELAVVNKAAADAASAAALRISELETNVAHSSMLAATASTKAAVLAAEIDQIHSLMDLLNGEVTTQADATALVRVAAYLAGRKPVQPAAPQEPTE